MIVLVVLAVIALCVVIGLLVGGLAVAVTGAMFLHVPFSDGWHDAWQNPWKLALFAFIILPFFVNRD